MPKSIAKSLFVKNHEFTSENGEYKINITKKFLSVSTTNYSTWNEFYSLIKYSCEALILWRFAIMCG